jgi:hypothetical protein
MHMHMHMHMNVPVHLIPRHKIGVRNLVAIRSWVPTAVLASAIAILQHNTYTHVAEDMYSE